MAVLAILPYATLLTLSPYIQTADFSSAFSFTLLFLPPSLIFGAILSFLLGGGEGRYNLRVLIRILFALNIVLYCILFYNIFTNI